MEVTANIQLTTEEKRELASILGCTQARIAESLQAHASAALKEYVSMFLGQKVFSRGLRIPRQAGQ